MLSKFIKASSTRNPFKLNSIFIILLIAFSGNIIGQGNFKIGINGTFARKGKSGFGSVAFISQQIIPKLDLMLSSGYISFKDDPDLRFLDTPFNPDKIIFDAVKLIPLQIGLKYNFGSDYFKPFVVAELGYNFVEYNIY